ncbi:MAG: hypothetical protein J6S67_25105 [Methanobrevibacter sp.]|nr:hypothetical protein [Methanobrevibacter sp.]
MKHAYSNIYDLVHGFFYEPQDGERCYTNGQSASFIGDRFISYNTCIGYVYTDKHGDKTLLVSDDNMSVTTSKQISRLINACPFSFIRVPFNYGYSYGGMTQDEIVGKIKKNLEERIEREIKAKYTYTRVSQRDSSEHLLSMVAKFMEKTGAKVKGAARFKKYLDSKLSSEAISKARQKTRKQAQIKAEKTRKAVEKFKKGLSNTPIYPLIVKYVFDWKPWAETAEEKAKKDLFLQSFGVENPSFVRVDLQNGVVVTTQRIRMGIDEVKPLLRMWKHGHNIVGVSCGRYTVLENNDKYVKIGCHNIPVANVKALSDLLL